MRRRVFDVVVLVLAGPTFGAKDAAAVDIFEIPKGELIMPFGLLIFFVIYSEIPPPVFGEPVLSKKFIFLLCRGLVFAPRIPVVEYEFALADKSLGVLVGPPVELYCHASSPPSRTFSQVRCCSNQSRASSATWSRVPGSSKRCVAPGTITSCFSQRSCARAAWFSAMTWTSLPPTINRVGARTRGRADPARSGRPPRETTAPTAAGRSAAATSAAPAPVLAPKYPRRSSHVSGFSASQSVTPTSRSASSPMLKRSCAVRRSPSSSSRVRRSTKRVASLAWLSRRATWRLRGLRRLLPLP